MADSRAREQQERLDEYMLSLYEPYRISKGYHDFYLGRQFSEKQRRSWIESGLPLLALNKVRPHIDQQAAILTERAPAFRIQPVQFGDEALARKWDSMMIWRWQECDGNRVAHNVVRDSLIYGVGWFHSYIDDVGNFGRPQVILDREHPHDVFPDPSARREDINDAHCILKRCHYSEKQVTERWGKQDWGAMRMDLMGPYIDSGFKDTGLSYNRGELDDQLSNDARIYEVVQGYYKVTRKWISLWDNKGFIRGAGPAEEFKGREREAESLGLRAVKFNMPRIEMIVTSGDVLLDSGDLPTGLYPLQPVFNSHDDVVTGASEIMFLQHSQEALNSTTNLMIRWIATSSNAPWVVQKGTVDKEEWAKLGAVQGAILEVERSATLPPQRQNPPSIPQGLFGFGQMLHEHMEHETGNMPVGQGDTSAAPDTFRATLQMEEWASRRMGRKRRMLNSTLKRIGRVMIDLSQATYTGPEIIRVVGRDGLVKEEEINTSLLTDITSGVYDLAVVDDSMMATSVQAAEAIEMERFKLGLTTKSHYIKHSNMPDKEDLLQELGEVAQATAAVQQMQQQMRSLQIQLTNLDSEVRRAKRETALAKFQQELESKLDEEQLKLEEEKSKLREAQRRLAFEIRTAKQNPANGSALNGSV